MAINEVIEIKYKLVAIDLDGTLLNDDKEISIENEKALKEINDMGIEIVIATGRRYWSAKEFVRGLDMDLVIMANNGNIVRNISNDEVLITKYLNDIDFYTLIKEGRKRGMYPVVHSDYYEDGYDLIIELEEDDSNYSSYMSKNIERYVKVKDLLKYKDPRALVVCYMNKYDELDEFQNILHEKYPNKYSSHIMNSLSPVGPILEVMNPLGSKWLSLKAYCDDKGIKAEEIVVIGDDNNDIEMIRHSGLGIAMKNAIEPVKSVADRITDKTNNEDGVAKVLKEIFKI